MKKFLKSVNRTIHYWYLPAVIGVIFIFLGVYLFSVPIATYLAIVMFFSLSFLISGILEIVFSVKNKDEIDSWGWYLIGGVFNVLFGVILLARPEISTVVLPLLIGLALLFRAIQGLGFSFDLKSYGLKKWWHLTTLSVIGVLFSFLVIINPIATGISLAILVAFSFVIIGVLGIILSVQLKKLKLFPKRITKNLREKIEDLKEEYYEIIDKD